MDDFPRKHKLSKLIQEVVEQLEGTRGEGTVEGPPPHCGTRVT